MLIVAMSLAAGLTISALPRVMVPVAPKWLQDRVHEISGPAGLGDVPVLLDRDDVVKKGSRHSLLAEYVNAYGDAIQIESRGLILTKADIETCGSDKDCLDGIIAHELGHMYSTNVDVPQYVREVNADMMSAYVLYRANMNPCALISSLKHFKKRLHGQDPTTITHPLIEDRINNVANVCVRYTQEYKDAE